MTRHRGKICRYVKPKNREGFEWNGGFPAVEEDEEEEETLSVDEEPPRELREINGSQRIYY